MPLTRLGENALKWHFLCQSAAARKPSANIVLLFLELLSLLRWVTLSASWMWTIHNRWSRFWQRLRRRKGPRCSALLDTLVPWKQFCFMMSLPPSPPPYVQTPPPAVDVTEICASHNSIVASLTGDDRFSILHQRAWSCCCSSKMTFRFCWFKRGTPAFKAPVWILTHSSPLPQKRKDPWSSLWLA